VFGFDAILALAGRAAHLEAVRQQCVNPTMDTGQPTDRLAQYLRQVQDTTARSIAIRPYDDATPTDTPHASLELGPGVRTIEIRFRPINVLANPTTERQVAHELTHALMIYSQGYQIPCAPADVSQYDVQTVAEIVDLVDDVIVDVTIHRRGFTQPSRDGIDRYTSMASVLLQASSRAQIDPYEDDPVRAEISLVKDYIYAWALPRFVDFPQDARDVFAAYVRRYPQVMKAEFEKAKQIKKLMMANDIFTLEGRTCVVVGATDLWPVNPRVYLATIAAA